MEGVFTVFVFLSCCVLFLQVTISQTISMQEITRIHKMHILEHFKEQILCTISNRRYIVMTQLYRYLTIFIQSGFFIQMIIQN